jgi:hypothetical protein
MKLEFIKKVFEFMNKFEQKVKHSENVPTTQQKILRLNLINEENNELIRAFFYRYEDYNKFLIELADAITDTIYVLYGLYADFGCTILTYDKEKLHNIFFDGIVWGETEEDKVMLIVYKTLPCFLGELYKSMVDNNHVKISENLCYVDFLLNHIADHYNFPVEELFNEVHRSNMSKLHDGVVVKNELGKVVKSPNYSPADIEGILRKQGLLK